ncbi:MAG: DUF5829 family protein [Crocinitomicaceae bacterium]
MKYILLILVVCYMGRSYAQQESLIRLNHLMLVVDSAAYASLCDMQSEIWYSDQKKLKYWEGLYIIGENNYLEIFHQNSMKEETLEVGENWTCYASMKSGHFASLTYDSAYIQFDENDYFKTLSCELNDELSPFQVWEMNQLQYETWTKKEFEEGMTFEPFDYNSQAESDSSRNYLFDDLVGVTYTIPSADSDRAIAFFKAVGYSVIERATDTISFDNGLERITLIFKDKINTVLINSLELRLKRPLKKEVFQVGLIKMLVEGNTMVWSFDEAADQ